MTTDPIENFRFERRIPDGDDRERIVCQECNWIHYENPLVIVGAVCTWGDTILLCKRAIEPRLGYWTIPAGFMELGESTEEGAKRETREEAGAEIEITALGLRSGLLGTGLRSRSGLGPLGRRRRDRRLGLFNRLATIVDF